MKSFLAAFLALFSSVSATASEIHFINHNNSAMVMIIGEASEDVSPIEIFYSIPSEKMRKLVHSGVLFFKGALGLESGIVEGQARIFKWGCRPHEYYVSGIFSAEGLASGTLELRGVAPMYGQGLGNCSVSGFSFDRDSRLTFEPLLARAR
jgi:hypothetical protein